MKIKAKDNDKFSITGLGPQHLVVIQGVLNHVRLGSGEASDVVFELLDMFDHSEEFDYESQFFDELKVEAVREDGSKRIKHPIIEVSFE